MSEPLVSLVGVGKRFNGADVLHDVSFDVLSESVTAAGRTWSVNGIGSMLDEATYVNGDLQMIALTIVSMVATVLVLNRAVWRPLYAWASTRYRFDV